MSGSIKLGLIIIASVLALGFVAGLIKSILAAVLPIAIVAGIGLVLYGLLGRKSLGSSRRRYLP